MNWIKSLSKLKTPFNGDIYKDSKIARFCEFINKTTQECNVVLYICTRYQIRPWAELSDIYEALQELQTAECTYAALESLFMSGWLQVVSEPTTKDGVQVCFTHNIEVALKTQNANIFKIHKIAIKTDRAIIRMHLKALHVKAALCDTDAFKRFCRAYVDESQDPLAEYLKRNKFDGISLSAIFYVFSFYIIEGRIIEIKPLVILLSSNRIEAQRYLEHWCTQNWKPISTSVLSHENGPNGNLFLKPTESFQQTICQFGGKQKSSDMNMPGALQKIEPEKIAFKPLFYNANILEQIQTLEHMLKPEGFVAYTQKLAEHSEHSGLTVLLSGGPGTGKTELARQLARMSGRALCMFNVSQQRDKFFGESEKNIKRVFDFYRSQTHHPKSTPILFFNEADSVFQNRQSPNPTSSNTEQVVQTILLNELEQFKGIIICTTNRADSFDAAFERRFLMHVKIDAPEAPTRKLIVQHMFPEFTDAQCHNLAHDLVFTAAELKNAKTLLLMHQISGKGTPCTYEALCKYLQKPSRKSIGYISI